MTVDTETRPATAPSLLERMFHWWNEAYPVKGSYSPEAFSRFFTDDAVMIIDGVAKAEGLDGLSRNFNAIQNSVDHVEMVMPPIETFSSGDRIFTYHKELVRHNGKDSVAYIMGYAVTRGDKIAKIDFINMNPDAAVALDKAENS